MLLHRSVEESGCGLGVDGKSYERLMTPLVTHWETLASEFLRPLHFPRHPVQLARFGLRAIRPAEEFACARFQTRAARGLFAGLAGHSILPLDKEGTAAFGLVLGMMAHA